MRKLYLDGLRSVCAVLIALNHVGHFLVTHEGMARVMAGRRVPRSLLWTLREELFGYSSKPRIEGRDPRFFIQLVVWLFMLMSGFLYGHKFFASPDKRPRDKAEAVLLNRLRLLPPLLVVHVSHLLYAFSISTTSLPSKLLADSVFGLGVPGLFSSALNGPLWILQALFFVPFYCVIIWLMVARQRRRCRVVLYLLISNYLYFFSPHLIGAVLGFVLADLQASPDVSGVWKSMSASWATPIACVLANLVCLLPHPWLWWSVGNTHTQCLSALGIFVFLLVSPRVQRLFSLRCLVLVSPYTYALYIVHLPVYDVLAKSVVPFLAAQGQHPLLVVPFAVVLTPLATFLLHRFVEQPSNRCLRSLFAPPSARCHDDHVGVSPTLRDVDFHSRELKKIAIQR